MKVLLIRPPIFRLCSNFSYYGVIPPIGLAYIAAALREAGHEVLVIDAAGEALGRFEKISSPEGPVTRQGLSLEEIVARIPADVPVVGITHMFLHEWPFLRELSEKIKQRHPGTTVILGGENATAFWRRIFEETGAVDHCILGEGERTTVQLIGDIEREKTVPARPGVASYLAGPSQTVRPAERITDLGSIARPAWDLFPLQNYLSIADAHGVNRGPSMPILATRGCPHECTFCSGPSMWTRRHLARDPADVIDEIASYVERYGIRNINFCDLTTIVQREWILEFCERLLQRSFRITWQFPSGTRSEALDAEVLQKMYAAGCRNISYSPENGSKRLLKAFRKSVDLPAMVRSLRAARKAGIITRLSVIIGHPKEKAGDMWRTFCFLMRCAVAGCDDLSVLMFAPYPGSVDTEELLVQGELVYGDNYCYSSLARSGASSRTYHPRVGTRTLVLLQYFFVLAFYAVAFLSRPGRFRALERNLRTGTEHTQVDQFIRLKFREKH